jgi:nucleoside-triphosphatase THEP1
LNVFLTGAPGAGKTYVLNQYIDFLNQHEVEAAVTAYTGIAASFPCRIFSHRFLIY